MSGQTAAVFATIAPAPGVRGRVGLADLWRHPAAPLLPFLVGFSALAFGLGLPPRPYGMASDWRVFYAAGRAVWQGVNPYNLPALTAFEQHAQFAHPLHPLIDRFAYLPVVALFFAPFAALGFWAGFAVYSAAGLAAAAWAGRGLLRRLGWSHRGGWLLAALVTPPATMGLFYGQVDLLATAGVVGCVLLAEQRRPLTAGVLSGMVLLKPDLLWPLWPALAACFWPRRTDLAAYASAAAASAVVLALLGGVLVSGGVGGFLHGLLQFSSTLDRQPNVSTLAAYGGLTPFPAGVRLFSAALGVSAVAGLVVTGAQRPPGSAWPLVGAALCCWLLLAPYAHSNDDLLLYPTLALLLAPEQMRLDRRVVVHSIPATFLLVGGLLIGWPAAGAVPLLLCLYVLLQRRRWSVAALTSVTLVGFCLLPMAGPLRLLPYSLVPLALLPLAALAVHHFIQSTRGGSPDPLSTQLDARLATA